MKVTFPKVQGEEVMRVEHMNVDFRMSHVRVHLDNLFNGNKVLGNLYHPNPNLIPSHLKVPDRFLIWLFSENISYLVINRCKLRTDISLEFIKAY